MSIRKLHLQLLAKKKRGSLSRVKSTPKEEGGGDKSELKTTTRSSAVRTVPIVPKAIVRRKIFLCSAQTTNKSINRYNKSQIVV
jgi:hypothetical protein